MFKRSTTSYGQTPTPVTPYQKAAQVWDERIGSARVQARNWRLMAFGCLVLAIGLSGGVVWQAGRSTITPYVVEVSTLGEVRAVGPATASYDPADAQIAYHLARFIENVRSLSIDPIVVRQNWLRAYDYAMAQAANTLNEYARENDPFSNIGQRTVTVEVTSLVRSSGDSFDVRWRERAYENGALAETARYTAVLSIVLQLPRTEGAQEEPPRNLRPRPQLEPRPHRGRKRMKTILVLTMTAFVAACATKQPPLKISYDPEDFDAAALTLEPPRPVEIVTVPEPLPLPGQLKRLPGDQSRTEDNRPPEERVTDANAGAAVEPSADGYVNAIQVYPYTEGALYQLYTAPENVSNIALQPGEEIVAVSAGDTVRWVIGDTVSGSGDTARAHVLVKPIAEGLSTNLVIITDRRAYHLELTSTLETYMASVSWHYPRDELLALTRRNAAAEDAAERVIDSGLDIDKLRFRYAISGDEPPWRPVRVFDDTHKVYIQFPARLDQGEAPPLFVVGPDGDNQLVNYRVRGRYYIVDRLFAAAELRLGEEPQQVVRITRTDGRPAVSSRERTDEFISDDGVFEVGNHR